jgi:hypothetical protein
MATVKLVLTNPINASLQAKANSVASSTPNSDSGAWDIVYFTRISGGVQTGDVYRIGKCTAITPNQDLSGFSATSYIVDVEVDTKAQTPDADDFIFFGKENKVNVSGIRGYFAEVEMKNNSTTAAKLFSVGSEIAKSSK